MEGRFEELFKNIVKVWKRPENSEDKDIEKVTFVLKGAASSGTGKLLAYEKFEILKGSIIVKGNKGNENVEKRNKRIIEELLENNLVEKDGNKYHKIDTKLENHEGTSNETTFNNITVHANPGNLHNEDGSIRYNNIKEGSRVWLVSEISENHYGKYVLATKTSTADDSWVVETFKKGEGNAKDFTKENINSEGGIKEGDTILVVEKNEVSLKLGAASTATEQEAYTAGAFFNEKSLYEGLNGLLYNQLRELNEEKERDIENKRLNKKEETWEAAETLLKEMAEVLFLSSKESVSMQDDYMKSMEHLLVYAVIKRVRETLEETASKETHADVGA